MHILTLNAGSNSLKFDIVRVSHEHGSAAQEWGKSTLGGSFDDIARGASFRLLDHKRIVHSEDDVAGSYEEAARFLFDWIERGAGRPYGVSSLGDIDRVAHRIVHGADEFPHVVLITSDVIHRIAALEELAPLHNEPARKVIEVARERFGPDFPQFAVFDTAFHRGIPDEAALYPLPLKLARRHRIRRYGFHGISHEYLALRAAELLGRPVEELKLITLHLEGGSSAAAIRDGRSIDTSMGFTPLEGLMMGTRSGDIDPAIPMYLMRKEGWDAARVEQFLNKECGLLGVSGRSADTRELRQHLDDADVDLALNMFSYRVRRYVGAYLAALGGADAIVFGGGIGENTALVRERIAGGFDWCGAILDAARNSEAIDREACISAPDATIALWVIPTQESLMMAHQASRA
jgi:acetate kinase